MNPLSTPSSRFRHFLAFPLFSHVSSRPRTERSASWLLDLVLAKYAKLWIIACWLGLAVAAPSAWAAEMAPFEVTARDGRLFPEQLTVPAGVKLKLTLRNEGKTPVEFENLELRVEKMLAPDAATVVIIQPLKPGSYPFIDDFHAETGKMLLIAK